MSDEFLCVFRIHYAKIILALGRMYCYVLFCLLMFQYVLIKEKKAVKYLFKW